MTWPYQAEPPALDWLAADASIRLTVSAPVFAGPHASTEALAVCPVSTIDAVFG